MGNESCSIKCGKFLD